MTPSHPTALHPFQYDRGKSLMLVVLAMAVLLVTALWARQQSDLDVVYALAPEWPALDKARLAQPHQETVLVKVEVDGFGNVVSRQLLSPRSIYSDSGLHAAELWKFGGPGPDAKILGMTATLKFTFQVVPSSTSADEIGTAFVPPYEVSLRRRATPQR